MGKGKYRQQIKPTEPLDRAPSPTSTIHTLVSVSFRYVKPGEDFCLSHCNKDEIRAYKRCLYNLTSRTWQQIISSGGSSGNNAGKAGLRYTLYADSALKKVRRPPQLSPELGISSVSASDVARLYGAYERGVYHILWFDPRHRIIPYHKNC